MLIWAKVLEAAMLVIFGASWPAQILKTIRVKNPQGKSFVFLYMIVSGYLCGLVSKFLVPGWERNWVIYIYVLDILMVSADIILSHWYLHRLRTKRA